MNLDGKVDLQMYEITKCSAVVINCFKIEFLSSRKIYAHNHRRVPRWFSARLQ